MLHNSLLLSVADNFSIPERLFAIVNGSSFSYSWAKQTQTPDLANIYTGQRLFRCRSQYNGHATGGEGYPQTRRVTPNPSGWSASFENCLMSPWLPYRDHFSGPEHTVTGSLFIYPRLPSPQLNNERAITVYVPPSYAASVRQYPVVYMMDGQNLFDQATAHSGEWQIDEHMERLSQANGPEAIIVGVANGGKNRTNEYSPFEVSEDGGGQAQEFLSFLTETVMPAVESEFRVSPRRADTLLFGSSLGALISLYCLFEKPGRFGGAGLMSPSLWHGDYAIFDYLAVKQPCGGRIYIDVGTRELSGRFSIFKLHYHSRQYYLAARKLYRHLQKTEAAGDQNLLYLEVPGARHSDREWSRRFPAALRFLFKHH